MKNARKLRVSFGLALLFLGAIIGVALMIAARGIPLSDSPIGSSLIQAILYLVGALIGWYVSHPLSHYISAVALGVRTQYFYLGRSELRNSGIPGAGAIAPYLITVGVKLDPEIKSKALSRERRAFVYGSGAIVSACVAFFIFVNAALDGYGTVSVVLSLVFFLFCTGNELFLSTKSGDLAKMKKALGR